jgi:hypothetical protein
MCSDWIVPGWVVLLFLVLYGFFLWFIESYGRDPNEELRFYCEWKRKQRQRQRELFSQNKENEEEEAGEIPV